MDTLREKNVGGGGGGGHDGYSKFGSGPWGVN